MATNSFRTVSKTVAGMKTSDGAGVSLLRVIGQPKLDVLDPFLLLDEFRNDDPDAYIAGFPTHPHRGFETVTYMVHGKMEHKDSRGNHGILESGSVQWMTAGRGILHSEKPLQENGLMHGYQLWVNLPAADKMCEPRYQDIPPGDVPVVSLDDGTTVKVIAGTSHGVEGAVQGVATDPVYIDVTLPPNAAFDQEVPADHTAFTFIVDGSLACGAESDAKSYDRGHLQVWEKGETTIHVVSGDEGARFLLVAAAPINEPVARMGPFVMNTQEELQQAVTDYHAGRLGRD